MNLKEYDVQYMYTWPFAARAVVILIICIIIFFFAYLLDFSSFARQSNTITTQTNEYILQYQSLLRSQARIEHEITQYSALEKTLQDWQNTLVPQHQIPELLNDILKIGTDIGLHFNVFNPDEHKVKKNYHITPLQVVAEGSFPQIVSFLSKVANLPSIVVLEKTTIKAQELTEKDDPNSQKGDNLTLALTIDIYYQPTKKTSRKL